MLTFLSIIHHEGWSHTCVNRGKLSDLAISYPMVIMVWPCSIHHTASALCFLPKLTPFFTKRLQCQCICSVSLTNESRNLRIRLFLFPAFSVGFVIHWASTSKSTVGFLWGRFASITKKQATEPDGNNRMICSVKSPPEKYFEGGTSVISKKVFNSIP